MKQILLVCSAGMSTSLLVTKMEGAAKMLDMMQKFSHYHFLMHQEF